MRFLRTVPVSAAAVFVVGLGVLWLRAGSDDPAAVWRRSCSSTGSANDADATVVVDEEGMLYVAVELERFLPRAAEAGQLVELDPYATGDPRVWGVPVPPLSVGRDGAGGIWAGALLVWSLQDPRAPQELWRSPVPSGGCIESTPAIWDGPIYVGSRAGFLHAFE